MNLRSMTKEKWKQYHRNWRCVCASLYEDESPIPYYRREQIEKHFRLARESSPVREAPSNILYLWRKGKEVRSQLVAHPAQYRLSNEWVANAVRSYMRRNTSAGRGEAIERHPCYWSQYEQVRG